MLIFLCILISIGFLIIFLKTQDLKLLETVTKKNRGTKTERQLVLQLLKSKIPPQTIFHDLYVRNGNGHYSQVDLVVATKVGIIVFEVKKYSGWIFGTGSQTYWTQVLDYGRSKYQFYNPILQNKKHITDLKKELLQFENIPFYSVVVFYGNCTFRNLRFIPRGIFLVKSEDVVKVVKKIIRENEHAKYTSKRDVVRVFTQAVKNGESETIRNLHVRNIKNMLAKD